MASSLTSSSVGNRPSETSPPQEASTSNWGPVALRVAHVALPSIEMVSFSLAMVTAFVFPPACLLLIGIGVAAGIGYSLLPAYPSSYVPSDRTNTNSSNESQKKSEPKNPRELAKKQVEDREKLKKEQAERRKDLGYQDATDELAALKKEEKELEKLIDEIDESLARERGNFELLGNEKGEKNEMIRALEGKRDQRMAELIELRAEIAEKNVQLDGLNALEKLENERQKWQEAIEQEEMDYKGALERLESEHEKAVEKQDERNPDRSELLDSEGRYTERANQLREEHEQKLEELEGKLQAAQLQEDLEKLDFSHQRYSDDQKNVQEERAARLLGAEQLKNPEEQRIDELNEVLRKLKDAEDQEFWAHYSYEKAKIENQDAAEIQRLAAELAEAMKDLLAAQEAFSEMINPSTYTRMSQSLQTFAAATGRAATNGLRSLRNPPEEGIQAHLVSARRTPEASEGIPLKDMSGASSSSPSPTSEDDEVPAISEEVGGASAEESSGMMNPFLDPSPSSSPPAEVEGPSLMTSGLSHLTSSWSRLRGLILSSRSDPTIPVVGDDVDDDGL